MDLSLRIAYRTTVGATLVAILLACACRPGASRLTGARADAAAAGAASRGGGKLDEPGAAALERRLALLAPEGDAPVDGVIRRLQEMARVQPDKLELWIALGQSWVRKARETTDPGYYRNADACAEIALAIGPDAPSANDLHALVMLNEHRFEEARAIAARVTASHKDDPVAWGNLSDALLELGRFDEAARAAQAMVSLKPNLPSYSRASHLRWLQGDRKAAKEIVRLAIDAASNGRDAEPRAWVLCQAAMIFWHEGDYDGADAGFTEALRSFADFAPALVGRARVALARAEWRSAVELLEKAEHLSPLIETAWLLADAQGLAGDRAAQQATEERIVKQGKRLDPRTLSLFLSTRGRDLPLALELAALERRSRGDVYTRDALGWALYRSGRVAEALVESDAAVALGTPDARLLYHSGAIRIAAGRVAEGRQCVREALTLNPKFDAVTAAEAQKLVAAR